MTASKTAPKTAAGKASDPEAEARREVTRMLKGPVAERFKALVPPLASAPDPFKAIMESPELLDACFSLFQGKRDLFAEFLVDAEGNPVADNATRLKCGRSVDEVTGMVVRTGMRAFADLHFAEAADPRKRAAGQAKPSLIHSLLGHFNAAKWSALFSANHGAEKSLPAGQTNAARFYASIKDHLDYPWQVRFFPIYVEIPSHVFQRLGHGITRLDTQEKLHRLANLAMADLQRAEQIIHDPALLTEMLENNILAAGTVSALGETGFEAVHGALTGIDPKKKWNVLANRDTAMKLHEDKRITKGDITALADYLDILNEFALDAMLDLHLNRDQMQMFLKTAEEGLGRPLFLALFGPMAYLVNDDAEEQQKMRRYHAYTQSQLRALVNAVKQLETSLAKPGEKADIAECLAMVCRSRRPDLEKEIKRLVPSQPH